MSNVVPAAFDPWAKYPPLAARCGKTRTPGTPDPLAQWQAAQDVLAAREACQAADGGCSVLRCIGLCALNQLIIPGWLADAFTRFHSRVIAAEVRSWDEAFGRPFPPHTRVSEIRRGRELKPAVHAAVQRLAFAEPNLPINKAFFKRAGLENGIHKSASTIERYYYAALADGHPNIARLRSSRLSDHHLSGQTMRIDFLLCQVR